MSFKIYRYILFVILTILFVVGFYNIPNWNRSAIETILIQIMQDYTGELSDKKDPEIPIPVSIEDIISKRYIYTLTKESEKKLSSIIGTGVTLDTRYSTFEKVFVLNDNFIFHFNSGSIEIPISSYFFDKLNQKKITVSGETSFNTGSGKKLIALTFDDGPSIKYTNTLLDILKNENVKATFYVLGSKAEQYPQIIQREYNEGHEIGNHSYSHAGFTKIPERAMQEEIYKTDQVIYRAIGIYPKTFRPPYGGTNSGILSSISMPAILWSIDPRDWRTHNIKKNILSISKAKDGDIIIMHDIHEASVSSIPEMIRYLKSEGFTFVTVSEILSLSDQNMQIGKICTKKGSCK